MKLIWSRRATRDLEQIGMFISLEAPERARAFVQSLIERGKQAALFPNAGRMVPEYQDENLRELIEGNYRIVYEVSSSKRTVVVLTVFEGHRLLKKPAHRKE